MFSAEGTRRLVRTEENNEEAFAMNNLELCDNIFNKKNKSKSFVHGQGNTRPNPTCYKILDYLMTVNQRSVVTDIRFKSIPALI